MKKNKMLRTASVLLILVMLTTSIIGGTFAKYTTTGTASDTARVAKWGVVINTSGSLFSDAYAKATAGDDKANLPAAWTNVSPGANSITVAAEAVNNNIVAPGTKSSGEGLKFSISGTPEVATKISGTIKARDIYLDTSKSYGLMVPATVNSDNWATLAGSDKLYEKNDSAGTYTKIESNANVPTDFTKYYLLHDATTGSAGTTYYPVVYSLDGSTGTTDTSSSASSTEAVAKALLEATTTASDSVNKETDADGVTTSYTVKDTNVKVFPANTNLAGADLFGDEKLTWEWKYEENASKDAEDTILGNMMAAVGSSNGATAINGATSDGSFVVYSTDSGYEDVYYDATNKLAKAGTTGNILASLETRFEISLTVTQVD